MEVSDDGRNFAMEAFFFKSPWVRALVPLLLMGVCGVATNTLVVEIAHGNEIRWGEIPDKSSFYIVLITIALSGYYQIALQRYDNELSRGFTPKQYEAQIRNRVAEGVAKRSQKLIREGNIDQLQKETEMFKKLYGEDQA